MRVSINPKPELNTIRTELPLREHVFNFSGGGKKDGGKFGDLFDKDKKGDNGGGGDGLGVLGIGK